MKKQIFVRDRAFYLRVLAVGVPIAAQQLITVGVNMMDTVMLGALGELPLSGSSLANQVFNLFHFMGMGMGMGASVLTARFWGARDMKNLKKSVTIMYRLCISVALIFTAIVLANPAGVMRVFTSQEEIVAQGVRYFRWAFPCFLLEGLSLTTTLVLRSSRQVKVPLYSSIFAFFLNIFCNWVFINGKLGMPRMEIAGAALGTLISRSFEVMFICGYFLFLDQKIGYRLRELFAPCGDLVPEYLRISIPVLISDTLLGLGNSMVSVVVGHISTAFVAANSITTVTQQLSTVFTTGIGQSAAIITGNTLGEGRADKAQEQGVTFAALGVLVGLACGGLIYALSAPVVGAYNITAETREIALELMHAVAITTVFMCLNSILTKGVLRGGGDTRFLMFADVFFLWAVSVPLGAAAGLVWHLPAFWIYFFLKIDHLIKSVICIARLKSKRWIKKIVVKNP